VIGAICLLVLVSLVAWEPKEVVALASTPLWAPPDTPLQSDRPAWESHDTTPVSLLIRNDGDEDDRLLGGSTPIAQCVELRRTVLVHGRPAVAEVREGIAIPARATLILEPGKSHLALFGLRRDLVQGERFPLTLRFERAGSVTLVARVRRRVDAAGIAPLPEVSVGDLTLALASAPPAPGPKAGHEIEQEIVPWQDDSIGSSSYIRVVLSAPVAMHGVPPPGLGMRPGRMGIHASRVLSGLVAAGNPDRVEPPLSNTTWRL
jgi:copper(I)-binding protein